MSNVLVTGIAGFVGVNVASKLVEKGHNVVGIVRDLKPLQTSKKVSLAFGDMTNQRLVERIISEYKIDTIYHFAASAIVAYAQRAPAQAISNNILGTLSVLEAARTCGGLSRIIIQTSDKVYGSQDSPLGEDLPLLADEPYSASKAACDILARSYYHTYGLPVVVVRPCNLFGPRDVHNRIIPNTIRACLEGTPPIIFVKDDQREFLYIDDLASALTLLAKEDCIGQVFNIGGGAIKNNGEVVLEVIKSFPSVKPKYVKPDKTIKEIPQQWLNSGKMRALGWEPRVSFEEGIRRTVSWWREQQNRSPAKNAGA